MTGTDPDAADDGAPAASADRADGISDPALATANMPASRQPARPSKIMRGFIRCRLPQRRQAYAERDTNFPHLGQCLWFSRTG
jgi:hypothetical protein